MDEPDHVACLLDVREIDAGERFGEIGQERVGRRLDEVRDPRKGWSVVEWPQQVDDQPAAHLLCRRDPLH